MDQVAQDNPIKFQKKNVVFKLRSACVCLRGDAVLLFNYPQFGHWSLPGGKCNLMETSENAAVRELFEEMHEPVKILRLLTITENFYPDGDNTMHEILFVYLAELEQDSKALKVDEFNADENGKQMPCKWVMLSDLGNYNLQPKVLTELLNEMPEQIRHIVNKELD